MVRKGSSVRVRWRALDSPRRASPRRGERVAVSFDPRSLVTNDAELRAVVTDYARQRIAFTEAWLAPSPLADVLREVQAGSQPRRDWSLTRVPAATIRRIERLGFRGSNLHL